MQQMQLYLAVTITLVPSKIRASKHSLEYKNESHKTYVRSDCHQLF